MVNIIWVSMRTTKTKLINRFRFVQDTIHNQSLFMVTLNCYPQFTHSLNSHALKLFPSRFLLGTRCVSLLVCTENMQNFRGSSERSWGHFYEAAKYLINLDSGGLRPSDRQRTRSVTVLALSRLQL